MTDIFDNFHLELTFEELHIILLSLNSEKKLAQENGDGQLENEIDNILRKINPFKTTLIMKNGTEKEVF